MTGDPCRNATRGRKPHRLFDSHEVRNMENSISSGIVGWTHAIALLALGMILCDGCGATRNAGVTVSQVQALEPFDALLPMAPDSIVELYRRNDPVHFHTAYRKQLEDARGLVDSLDGFLDSGSRIDTLAIDHTFDNFGTAA